jgi:hypothetical protein
LIRTFDSVGKILAHVEDLLLKKDTNSIGHYACLEKKFLGAPSL